MEADYNEKRKNIDPAKKNKWIKEQQFIRKQIITQDDFTWKAQDLKLIAGVDVSFSGKFNNAACVGLLVYDCQKRKIVYEDYEYVILLEEYIPGFLAFRQLPPTLQLFKRLKEKALEYWPQLIMVDGNGILHKYQCGYASHLGVVLNIPTIGCAKTFFDVDGLHQQEIEQHLTQKLNSHGQYEVIKGKSGKQWCSGMLTDVNQNQHLYISIGTKISLKTATEIVKKYCPYETPQPVRLVDKNSRKKIKKLSEEQVKLAKSYEMIYLA